MFLVAVNARIYWATAISGLQNRHKKAPKASKSVVLAKSHSLKLAP
jgi:hypothetical protein